MHPRPLRRRTTAGVRHAKLRGPGRQRARISRRIANLQSWLAQIRDVASRAEDRESFAQAVCDLAVETGSMTWAFVAYLAAKGELRLLARAGDRARVDAALRSAATRLARGGGTTGLALAEGTAFALDSAGESREWLVLPDGDEGGWSATPRSLLMAIAHVVSVCTSAIVLRQRLALLQRSVDALPVGLSISDKHRVLIQVNSGFESMTGYSASEVLGRNCRFLQDARTDPAAVQRIRDALSAGREVEVELRNVRKDGKAFWNALQITPVRDVHGSVTNFVGIQLDVTERHEAQELQHALLENAAAGIAVVRDRRLLSVNSTLAEVAGRSVAELQGQDTRILYATQEDYRRVGDSYRVLRHGQAKCRVASVGIRHARGHTVLCDLIGHMLPDGQTTTWTYVDITERELRKAELERSQRFYRALMRQDEILLKSRRERVLLEETCRALIDQTDFLSTWIYRPDGQGGLTVLSSAGDGAEQGAETAVRSNEGGVVSCALVALETGHAEVCDVPAAPVKPGTWEHLLLSLGARAVLSAPLHRDGQVWGGLAIAATGRAAFGPETVMLCERLAALLGHGLDELDLRARLNEQTRREAHLARHDALTGLLNRFALDQHLPFLLARARRQGKMLAVGILDLDDFKPVNDSFGHAAGDALLVQLAQRFKARLRESDVIARLGGDEFVVVLEDLEPHHATEQLLAVLARLHTAVESPFDLGASQPISVGVTLGLALFPTDGVEASALLRQADSALYRAKAHKFDRTRWWAMASEQPEEAAAEGLHSPATTLDPFGEEAVHLLRGMADVVRAVEADFGEAVLRKMQTDSSTSGVLACMDESGIRQLREGHARHVQFLLSPDTTAGAIALRARELGQRHALIGVAPSTLVEMTDLYRQLLDSQLQLRNTRTLTQLRLAHLAQARLGLDMRGQLEAYDATQLAFESYLARPLPRRGQPACEVLDAKLRALAELPGVVGVALLDLDPEGLFRPLAAAGSEAERIRDVLATPGWEPRLAPDAGGVAEPEAEAWSSAGIVSLRTIEQGGIGRFARMQALGRLGVRSLAMIALLHEQQAVQLLALYGSQINQFDTNMARNFLLAAQGRWSLIEALTMVDARQEVYRGSGRE